MAQISYVYLTEKEINKLGGTLPPNYQTNRTAAENSITPLLQQDYIFFYKAGNSTPEACYFKEASLLVPTEKNNLYDYIIKNKDKCPNASTKQLAPFYNLIEKLVDVQGRSKKPDVKFLENFQKFSIDLSPYSCYMPYNASKDELLPTWNLELKNLADFEYLYEKTELMPNLPALQNWLKAAKTKISNDKLKEYLQERNQRVLGSKILLTDKLLDDGKCWEAYEKSKPGGEKICCQLENPNWMCVEEPLKWVNRAGIVSIDFGTKSTVIVIWDGAKQYTFNFQNSNNDTEIDPCHPTVLKFSHINEFLNVYNNNNILSWPETTSDMVSVENEQNDNYKGIFGQLKQWMLDSKDGNKILRQDNEPDNPIILSRYGNQNNPLDPIELYAYYLGLKINNNMDNQIFLRYRLSFSYACSKDIREKMEESFKRGLLKSLPPSVVAEIEKEETMFPLKVECICSEPTAYAACILNCMGMPSQIEQNERNFRFGIFDFGGGTCDFSYGILFKEKDDTFDQTQNNIQILGNGGDPFLGGENILELLAVKVFMKNKDTVMKGNWKIPKPRCYEGHDLGFFSDSYEANSNMKQLVDQLRKDVWEKESPSDMITIQNQFIIEKSNILGQKGNAIPPTTPLTVKLNDLEEIIKTLIKKGVKEFFETFFTVMEEQNEPQISHLCIFLAGNSCRSKWVREMFNEYIQDKNNYQDHIGEIVVCDPIGLPKFIANIPTGYWDEQQIKEIEKRIKNFPNLNGKTGVAYGLSFYDETIKQSDNENKFRYFIGTRQGSIVKRFTLKTNQDFETSQDQYKMNLGESYRFSKHPVPDLYYSTLTIPGRKELKKPQYIALNWLPPLEGENIYFIQATSDTEVVLFQAPKDTPENHQEEFKFDLRTGNQV